MITIETLIPAYLDYLRYERMLTESTIRAYRSDLNDLAVFLCDRDVSTLQIIDLRAYMRDLARRGYAVRSIRRKFHGLGTFWRWLVMEGHTDQILTERLRLPKKPKTVRTWLNPQDLQRFITTMPDRADLGLVERDQAAWRMLAWLGLRRGELLNLAIEDVDLVGKMLFIRNGKSGDRVLPLPDQLIPDLEPLIAIKPAGYVFSSNHRPWTVRAFTRGFSRHLRACGLDGRGITPHTLRHTFATQLIAAGVPQLWVTRLLGHSRADTTLEYVHILQVDRNLILEIQPLARMFSITQAEGPIGPEVSL